MKKSLFIILLLAVFFTACKTAKFSKSGEAEKQYVSTFLTYMDRTKGPNRDAMMACIAPSYIAANFIDITKYKVNNYSVWGFSIESYNPVEGIIVTKVWGESKKWIHQLDFKIVKESGKLYLMPSKHSDAYIDPWFVAKTYVKE